MIVTNREQHPAIFLSKTTTKLVLGRTEWKVPMLYPYTAKNIEEALYLQDERYQKELTPLEELYKEFCRKAHNYLIGHSTNNGDNTPHRIIFPDFHYEIIPTKPTIE